MVRDRQELADQDGGGSGGCWPFAVSQASPVHAQSIMRTPSLHMIRGCRRSIRRLRRGSIPVSPDGPALRSIRSPARHRPPTDARGAARGHTSTLPYARYSPNLYPACDYAYRGSDGECFDRPVADGGGGGNGSSAKKGQRRSAQQRGADGGQLRSFAQRTRGRDRRRVDRCAGRRTGAAPWPDAAAIAEFSAARRNHRPVPHHRPPAGRDRAAANLPADGSVRSVQLNFRYLLQDQKAAPSEGDPAQYALAQLRLPQAHTLAHGMNVTVAVINSGIDAGHPELGEFDRRQL